MDTGKLKLVAMKGHPGSGKSTLAITLARKLGFALVDKDDIRDCTMPLQASLDPSLLNALSYQVMWQIASKQLQVGLNVVVDCPLSRPSLFESAQEVAERHGAELRVVECRPGDTAQWKKRLESRAESEEAPQPSLWHKPAKWEDMQRIMDAYAGCWDYDTGSTKKLVVDTTAATAADAQAFTLLWLNSPHPHTLTFFPST